MTLEGRTALVTGGGRGLGRAYVLELARQATVTGIEPSWDHTWPGLLALAGMFAVLGALALRALQRLGH